MIDLHLRPPAGSSAQELRPFVDAAAAAHLSEIAFVERLGEGGGLGPAIDALRPAAERSGLLLRRALLVEWRAGDRPAVAAAAESTRADVVLVTIPAAGGIELSDDAALEAELSERPQELWTDWWKKVRAAARSGLFDVVSGLDAPKRLGHLPSAELDEAAELAISALAAADVAIECGTAGWREPAGEPYPGGNLLRLALHYGIPLTVGSGAARPDDVGRGVPKMFERLRSFGAPGVVTFAGRERHSIQIGDGGDQTRIAQPVV